MVLLFQNSFGFSCQKTNSIFKYKYLINMLCWVLCNLIARKQHMYFSGASVTTVRLFFFVIGRVLTRLD